MDHLDLLLELPSATLRDMAASLKSGILRHGITRGNLASFAGPQAAPLVQGFKALQESGASAEALSEMVRLLAEAKFRTEAKAMDMELILSGPPSPVVPVRDMPSTVRALFEEAERTVLVASYVFFGADELLRPLVERHDKDPNFSVRFVVDLSHQRKGDEPLPLVANRWRKNFLENQWKGERPPEIWHDPRVFEMETRSEAGVMHAKVVVIDDKAALETSANFTNAACHRNIEAGFLVRRVGEVRRIRRYFEGLMETVLKPVR